MIPRTRAGIVRCRVSVSCEPSGDTEESPEMATRGKKKTTPTEEVQQEPPTTTMGIATPTRNSFEVLQDAPQKLPTPERVPPIVVDGTVADIKLFISTCDRVTKNRVTLKSTGRTTQVFPKTKDDHNALRELFVKNNLLHHTFAFKEQRKRKWVIHGLPRTADIEDIMESAKEKLPGVETIIQMSRTDDKGLKTLIPTYIMITGSEVTAQMLSNLVIYHHRVRVEKFISTQTVTQCFKCQMFGHSSKYCNLKARCVRCSGEHSAQQCDRKNVALKCANCGEAHVASFRKCKSRDQYMAKRTPPKKTLQEPKRTTSATVQGPKAQRPVPAPLPPRPVTMESSYSRVASNKPTPTPSSQDTMGFISDLGDIHRELQALNLPHLISTLKNLVRDLKTASNGLDRIEILLRYAPLLEP